VATTSLNHSIDLEALNKHYKRWWKSWPKGVHLEYDSETDIGATIYFKKPEAAVRLFKSGKLVCAKCKSESQTRLVIKKLIGILSNLGFVIKPRKFDVTIENIVCSINLGKKIGCGIVEKAFPEAKRSKFGTESFILRLDEGLIKFFLNGKILGMGFKDIDSAKNKITEIAQKTFLAIKQYDKERTEVCKIERFNPTVEFLKQHGKNLFDSATGLLEEILQEAELIVRQYYSKRIRDTAGHGPKIIAAGAVYIACRRLHKQTGDYSYYRTQREVAEVFSTTEVGVRSGYQMIAQTLNLKEFF